METQGFKAFEINDLDNSKVIRITKEISFVGQESRFGTLPPRLFDFLKYANIEFFTQGWSNYNNLGLTTQVPAIVNIILKENVEFLYKFNGYNFIVDPNYFGLLNQEEYVFFDTFKNLDQIDDSYFKSKDEMKKYLKNKMKQRNINVNKIMKILEEEI